MVRNVIAGIVGLVAGMALNMVLIELPLYLLVAFGAGRIEQRRRGRQT